MAAKRRAAQQRRWAAPARPRPIAATEGHESVTSPAALLQAQLDAAIHGPWAGHAASSETERWPGAARVAILLGGTVGSWALLLGVIAHFA